MPDVWHPLDPGDVVKRYTDGESVNALSKSCGVGRAAVATFLRRAAVTMRTASEQERIKWAGMTAERRRGQVASAHDAARGSVRTMDSKRRHALGVQRLQSNVSEDERALAVALHVRGIETVPQQAIGIYNCDLGASPVAVEVFGGNWHIYGAKRATNERRIGNLLDAGWHVLAIIFARRPVDYDKIAAALNEFGREPSLRREYRVIWSNGEAFASGSADDDQVTLVNPLRNPRNVTTGRYESVPR